MKELANEFLYEKASAALSVQPEGSLVPVLAGAIDPVQLDGGGGVAEIRAVPERILDAQPICAPLKHGKPTTHFVKLLEDYEDVEAIKTTIMDLVNKDCPISCVVVQADGIQDCDLDMLITTLKSCPLVEDTALCAVRKNRQMENIPDNVCV